MFWAISVPIAFGLGIYFLSPFPAWVKKKWQQRKTNQTAEDIQQRVAAAALDEEQVKGMSHSQRPSKQQGILPSYIRDT